MQKTKIIITFPALVLFASFVLSGEGSSLIPIIFASAIHEFGHIFAAFLLRIPLTALSFDILGARLNVGPRLSSYKDEVLLCAAGPAANFISVLIFLPQIIRYGDLPNNFFSLFFASSIALGLLNLAPIASFDGGRILTCLISMISNSTIADKVIRYISFLCVFVIWSASVYLLLKTGSSLSVFVFSILLFTKLFIKE